MTLRFELLKMRRSRRPWVAVLCLALFLFLMLVGFYTYAQTKTGGQAEFRYTYENRSYFNGLTFALYSFYFGFLLLLPTFAVTEGGVQLAGEVSQGTLPLLLARPRSRGLLFAHKALVAFVFAGGLTVLLLGVALLIGLIAVGWGDLNLYPGVLQMTDRPQHLAQSDALARFLLVAPAAWLALSAPLALSLLLSAWVRQPVNAVGASVALYLVLYVVSEIHFFERLRPFLFTTSMAYWRGLFREEIDWPALGRDLAKVLSFTAAFLALAWHRFCRQEATT